MMKNIKLQITILTIFITVLIILIPNSCKKLDIKRVMAVRTDTVIVSNTIITAKGTIIDLGQGITDYGFYWATTTKPTINDNKTSHGSASETGTFTDTLTNLSPNTTYYIVAYAKNSKETFYSKEINFTTNNFTPTVTTTAVTSITGNSATSGGNVTDDGGATVTIRGVCWNTSPNPTIAYSHTTDGSGIGIFTSSITGLSPNTSYYVRAYATNSAGTSYGNQVNFTANTTAGSITTYTGKILGGASHATIGSFFSTSDGSVMLVAAANSNQSKVDLIFTYNGTNYNLIAAPNDADIDAAFSNVTSWTTKNATLFKTTSGITWASVTDDNPIVTAADGASATRLNNLAVGQIFAIITAGGKKGLVHVSAIGGTVAADRTITIDVKIQP